MSSSLVVVEGLRKSFGGAVALADVSLEIGVGEVHALCGENGAGKSTLIKILGGVLRPDRGAVRVADRPFSFGAVTAATAAGIAVIHQETVAFPHLDVVDNLFVGRELRGVGGLNLDRPAMRRQTEELLERLGEPLDLSRPVGELSIAHRQIVAIARALSQQCRLLIMDEPTASLSARETDAVFRVVRQLRDDGISVLYVSHRLDEIFSLSQRTTVLRDGRLVATRPTGELTRDQLVQLMVGRELAGAGREPRRIAPTHSRPTLEVKGLTRSGEFDDVSFQVARGEIVGLGGLVGAGRSEVARAIFGVDSYDAGEVRIDGELLPAGSVRVAIHRGVALVPEDRQLQGLVAALSVQSNMTLPQWARFTRWALMSPSSERATVSEMASRLGLKAPSLAAPMTSLSGGNQQKVVVGKWLATEPRLLILDEPTRGVDVGAKAELYRAIRQLADQGLAILLISSDLPELLQLSDRIVVMRSGRVSGEVAGDAATEQQVLQLALPGAGAVTVVAVEMTSEAKAAAVTSAATTDATSPATTTVAERKEAAKAPPKRWLRREWGLAAVLLVCGLFVGAMNPAFLGAGNLGDLLVHAAPVAIVACGLTFVVVTGEIDISLGSLMGVCAATLGLLCGERELHWPVPLAVGAVLALGAAVGCVNGLLVTVGRVPSIIVTLGMLSVLRGVTELLMSGRWITDLPSGLRWLGTGGVLGVRFCVLAAASVFVASMFVAHATPLGRRLYALGSNPEAARLIGLSSLRLKLGAFCLTGFLVALATVVSAPQLSVIESGIGVGFELTVVTCVVVGGVSIAGGQGTLVGVLLGVALLGAVRTALIFLKLGDGAAYWERAIHGAFILLAVLVDHGARRRSSAGDAS